MTKEKNVIRLQLVTLSRGIFKQLRKIEDGQRVLFQQLVSWDKVDEWNIAHTVGYVLFNGDNKESEGLYLVFDTGERLRISEVASLNYLSNKYFWVAKKPHIFIH